MSARSELLREMTHNHLYMDDERANELIDAFAHELAELQRLRMDELDLTGQKARIVGRIVDLIDPSAGPVRPGEEPT